MTEAIPIGACNDFHDLQRIIRKRKDHLGWSNTTLDNVAGLPDGMCNKLLADPPKKNVGVMSFGLLLQALGMYLVVVEDAGLRSHKVGKVPKRQEQWVRKRDMQAVGSQGEIVLQLTRRQMKRIASMGGKNRWIGISKWQRSR